MRPNEAGILMFDDKPWKEVSKRTVTLQIVEDLEFSLRLACSHTSQNGIARNAIRRWTRYVQDIPEKNRLLLYMFPVDILRVRKLGRSGKGLDYTASIEDSAIMRAFIYLSYLFPFAYEVEKDGVKVKWPEFHSRIIVKTRSILSPIHTVPSHVNQHVGRLLWPHQQIALEWLLSEDKRGAILNMTAGLGKTLVAARYMEQFSYGYNIFTLPEGAIDTVTKEFQKEGWEVNVIDGRKNKFKGFRESNNMLVVNLVQHKHLRLLERELMEIMPESFIVVDEVHKATTKSMRSSVALQLVQASARWLAMTGTLVTSKRPEGLLKWLRLITVVPITFRNYIMFLDSLEMFNLDTGIKVVREHIEVNFTPEEKKIYINSVVPRLGGISKEMDFRTALNISTEASLRKIADDIASNNWRAFVSVGFKRDAQILEQLLVDRGVGEIFRIQLDKPLTLNSDYNGPIRVVITTKQHSEGYTLTTFNRMISTVFPSNQATRTQLEARINRKGQASDTIEILTYYAGILSYMLDRYEQARDLENRINQLMTIVQA